MRRHTLALAAGGILAGVAAILTGILSGVGVVEQAQLAARYTARTSFPLFLIVFTASAWQRMARTVWSRWLLRERRGVGLAFAAAHLVHLGALTGYFVISGESPPVMTVIGGGLAYIGIVALVLTSTDAAMRRMGRHWATLHRGVAWYVWAIFLFSYGRRALMWPEFGVPVVLLLAAAGAKLFAPRLIPRS